MGERIKNAGEKVLWANFPCKVLVTDRFGTYDYHDSEELTDLDPYPNSEVIQPDVLGIYSRMATKCNRHERALIASYYLYPGSKDKEFQGLGFPYHEKRENSYYFDSGFVYVSPDGQMHAHYGDGYRSYDKLLTNEEFKRAFKFYLTQTKGLNKEIVSRLDTRLFDKLEI